MWSDRTVFILARISHILLQSGEMDNATFKRKRKRLGLTQEELAKRLDINRMTIIRYESGESAVPKPVEMAMKLIEAEEKK